MPTHSLRRLLVIAGLLAGCATVTVPAPTICLPPGVSLAGATALASLRTGIFPQWYGLASAAGTVWFVVAGFSWAREGFFEVDGAAVWVGLIVFLAWTLVSSVVLLQQAQAREEAPRAAMASM